MFRLTKPRAVLMVAALAVVAWAAPSLVAQLYWCFEICHGVAMIVWEATGDQGLANDVMFACMDNICP